MSFTEILTLTASNVTIFAFIVGVFSVYNGRKTRNEISRLMKQTNSLIEGLVRGVREDRKLREEEHKIMMEEHKRILERLA